MVSSLKERPKQTSRDKTTKPGTKIRASEVELVISVVLAKHASGTNPMSNDDHTETDMNSISRVTHSICRHPTRGVHIYPRGEPDATTTTSPGTEHYTEYTIYLGKPREKVYSSYLSTGRIVSLQSSRNPSPSKSSGDPVGKDQESLLLGLCHSLTVTGNGLDSTMQPYLYGMPPWPC